MQRDFKVGLVVGVFALLGVLIWLASRESLSPEARLEKHFQQTQQSKAQAPKALEPAVGPNVSVPTTAKQAMETKQVPTPDHSLHPPDETGTTGPVDLAGPETHPKIKTQRFHIVRKGETLTRISQQHYGSVRYVDLILEANEDVIKNADLIQPGMRLIIPELDETP